MIEARGLRWHRTNAQATSTWMDRRPRQKKYVTYFSDQLHLKSVELYAPLNFEIRNTFKFVLRFTTMTYQHKKEIEELKKPLLNPYEVHI